MIDIELLFGIYEMQSIVFFENGAPGPNVGKSGMFIFSRDHRFSVVNGSHDWVMAYCGSFELQENRLQLLAESCVKRELEGTFIARAILRLDHSILVLDAGNTEKRNRCEITWKKTVQL